MSSTRWCKGQSRYVCICAYMWVYVPIHRWFYKHGSDRQCVSEFRQRTISANSGISNNLFSFINQRSTRVRTLVACVSDPLLRATVPCAPKSWAQRVHHDDAPNYRWKECKMLITESYHSSRFVVMKCFYCTDFWPRFVLSILRWLDSSNTIFPFSFVILYVALSSEADNFSVFFAPN